MSKFHNKTKTLYTDQLILKGINQRIKNNNIVITKADKGNNLVIMNRSNYLTNTLNLLDNIQFEILKKSPLNIFQEKLRNELKSSTEFLRYFDKKPTDFIIQNPKIPLLYSLPKIHKTPVTHRPIVSFIGSPMYKIAQFLSRVLPSALNFKPKFL